MGTIMISNMTMELTAPELPNEGMCGKWYDSAAPHGLWYSTKAADSSLRVIRYLNYITRMPINTSESSHSAPVLEHSPLRCINKAPAQAAFLKLGTQFTSHHLSSS